MKEFVEMTENKHVFQYRIINGNLTESQKTMMNLMSSLYAKELHGKS